MIETRKGSIALALAVIVTAIIGGFVEYYLPKPSQPHARFGGMSGVNYALFGYAWVMGRTQPHLGIGLAPQTATVMMFWLVLCFTGLVGPVANAAHVAGLVCGAGFAYVPFAVRRWWRRR